MAAHAVQLELADDVYQLLIERAERSHRSLEAVLHDVVQAVARIESDVPPSIQAEMALMVVMSDEELWRFATSTTPLRVARKRESLIAKKKRQGLTDTEAATLAALMHEFDRVMLIRAEAAAQLKRRGHDVTALVSGA